MKFVYMCLLLLCAQMVHAAAGGTASNRVDEAYEAALKGGRWEEFYRVVKEAAEAGDPVGQNVLGALYLNGQGYEKNPQLGIQ